VEWEREDHLSDLNANDWILGAEIILEEEEQKCTSSKKLTIGFSNC
jgi:hypothetical protein